MELLAFLCPSSVLCFFSLPTPPCLPCPIYFPLFTLHKTHLFSLSLAFSLSPPLSLPLSQAHTHARAHTHTHTHTFLLPPASCPPPSHPAFSRLPSPSYTLTHSLSLSLSLSHSRTLSLSHTGGRSRARGSSQRQRNCRFSRSSHIRSCCSLPLPM